MPDPAPTPTPDPKPAKLAPPPRQASSGRTAQVEQLWSEREEKVLAAIADAGEDGISPAGIREATGLTKQQTEITVRKLGNKVSAEGTRKSRRYFVGGADRPSPAPTSEGRAPSAPARRTHARRETEAAAAHNSVRDQVKTAVLQILEDGPAAGMGKDRLTAAVLDAVPGATSKDVTIVRVALTKKQGAIEMRANKVCLDRTKPITAVEKEVVDCLGSGRTVKEVAAANCQLIRNAFSARTILAALEQRGVVGRRPGGEPAVYIAVDQLQEVAA